ncbi:probable polygalacturonase At3g15720 [Cajanus cajan]|uniref:probable polygalacturonase At3g15720 n=1 Tax=Cajanus cajan TaxID=3821 RepID=UPI00098DAF61|nr:probable polygalacturonase At3g15720 [Cajanus cajan]
MVKMLKEAITEGMFLRPLLIMSIEINVATQGTFVNVIDQGARGDGKTDDSNAILSAWQRVCGMAGPATLLIPATKIFFVKRLQLNGPCKAQSVHIQFAGKIVAPTMNAWVGDKGSWIVISNVNGLTIDGQGGIIDGIGSSWWQKCKTCQRPASLRFQNCNSLVVNSLRMTNSPGAHIAISSCNGAKFSQMNINAPQNSPNTDGFDIAGSKFITIQDSTIATGDDCIAINSGCSNINATRLFCGPGHGISIGSLGRNGAHETVEEVYVQNCSFIGTTNGARIKTVPGGSGYARKITFDQIILKDAQNPIIIDQNYGGKIGASSHARDLAILLNCSTLGCFNLILNLIMLTLYLHDQENQPMLLPTMPMEQLLILLQKSLC